jgi:hypothetical protein
MSKRDWEIGPIETKESTFVMWPVHLFFKYVESWDRGKVGRKMRTLAFRS